MEILSHKLASIEKICFEKNWSRDQIHSTLSSKNTVLIVYCINSKIFYFPDSIIPSECDIIAFAFFNGDGLYEPIDCLRICVQPKYQRRGIATLIFQEFVIQYQKKIKKNLKILLEVAECNSVALLFYQKLGFKIISKRKKYYGKEDALVLQWQIDYEF